MTLSHFIHIYDTPNITPLDRVVIAARDLTSALTQPHHDLPMLILGDNNDILAAFKKIAEVLHKKYSNKQNSIHQNSVKPPRVHKTSYQPFLDAAPTRVKPLITQMPS